MASHHAYWGLCAEQLRRALKALADRGDVYVLVLQLFCEQDDGRRPVLELRWNTEAHHATQPPSSNPGRAARQRWNYGFFVAERPVEIGLGGDDLRRDWVAALGGGYSDAQRDDDLAIEADIATYHAAIDAMIAMVRDAHSSGLIEQTFGPPIPVLILGDHDDRPHLRWTLAANPQALAGQFPGYFELEYGQ